MIRIAAWLLGVTVGYFTVGLGSLAIATHLGPLPGVAAVLVGLIGLVLGAFRTLDWVIDG